MSNDRAQELTAKINQSITALCAETDAAKQSETYLAWLSTVSRFYRYSVWQLPPHLDASARGHPRCRVQHLEIIRPICEEGRNRYPHPRSHRS